MTVQAPPAADSGVLRNVVLLDKPHALARPMRGAAVAVPAVAVAAAAPAASEVAAADPQAHADAERRGYEQGARAGYAEGFAAGQAQQLEHDEAQLRRVLDEARAAAVEEGRAEGLRRAQEEFDAAVVQMRTQLTEEAEAALREHMQRLDQLAASLSAQSNRVAAEAEDGLVALAFEAVCRLLGRHATEPQVLRGMVRELLAARASNAREQLAVHLHPEDHAWLQREHAKGLDAWQWVADETVELGGVLLRWPHGALDGRLETQLDVLRQELLRVREERRAAIGKETAQ